MCCSNNQQFKSFLVKHFDETLVPFAMNLSGRVSILGYNVWHKQYSHSAISVLKLLIWLLTFSKDTVTGRTTVFILIHFPSWSDDTGSSSPSELGSTLWNPSHVKKTTLWRYSAGRKIKLQRNNKRTVVLYVNIVFPWEFPLQAVSCLNKT